jgi:hypothetical protein
VFRRKPRIAEPYRTWIEELIAEQRAAGHRWYGFEPRGAARLRADRNEVARPPQSKTTAARLRDLGGSSNDASFAQAQTPVRA